RKRFPFAFSANPSALQPSSSFASRSTAPDVISLTRPVPSHAATSTRFPSGWTSRAETLSSDACHVFATLQLLVFQKRTFPSSLPVATWVPAALKAKAVVLFDSEPSSHTCLPVGALHSPTTVFAGATAIRAAERLSAMLAISPDGDSNSVSSLPVFPSHS